LIRRVTSVNEIIGYEPSEGKLNYIPVFLYDADIDQHRFMGTSYLFETKLLEFRGWSKKRLKELYDEMMTRAEILKILSERSPRYVDVWRTVVLVQRFGPWEVYQKLKAEKL